MPPRGGARALALGLLLSLAGADQCSLTPGKDCTGNDIGNAPAVDANACCGQCANHQGSKCNAFTWDEYAPSGAKQGTCYLKSACPTMTDNGSTTAGIVGAGPSPGPGPTPPAPTRPALPVTSATTRARSIVDKMTTAEKASILNGMKSAAYGDGHNGYYVGNTLGVARLNVPSFNMQDASQGFRTVDSSQYGQVTSWPCSLAITANWDGNATEVWGKALGAEFRAKGANMILGPSLNVHRVAKGGRNAEYISGEDAFLGSVQVAAYVRGVQSQKVVANIKHYVLNNQETNRKCVCSSVPSGRRPVRTSLARPRSSCSPAVRCTPTKATAFLPHPEVLCLSCSLLWRTRGVLVCVGRGGGGAGDVCHHNQKHLSQ